MSIESTKFGLVDTNSATGLNRSFQTYGPRVISIADGTYTLANLLTAIVNATNAFFAGIPDATTITWTVVGEHIQVTTVGKNIFNLSNSIE